MSGKRGGKALGWLVAIAAGIGIGYLVFSPKDESIQSAVNQSHVSVEVHAENETAATISVARLADAPSHLTLTIPAGTPIRNNDRDGQWLITARPVTVRLSQGTPQFTQEVETYCLHQFDDPPTAKSDLSIAAQSAMSIIGGGGVVEEEMEPLRKLASCMAGRTDSRQDRELAVWLLADDRASKSYSDVRDELRRQYQSQGAAKMRTDLEGDIRESLRRQFPGLSEERLGQELEYYRENTLEKRIAREAEEKTDEELRGFVRVRPILEQCGSKPGEMRFFRTVQ